MPIPDRLAAALADRYRLERELGQGGMATVYLAEDLKHKRKVAVKVLKPELAAVLGAERFLQEITTTAALQHPHILPLFDSGTADSFLYYVMPFVDGETLRTKLDRETQLGVDEAVKLASEVADALHYAHSQGVIHRDIKPENILLANGRPVVADFGIALAVSAAAGGRMTETGLSLGTPHYMSPEQATAEKEITARSDQYSLASVLYEMLTGNPPHVGASAQQIIMKIITEQPANVTALRKSVPAHVAAAVATALEKLPADRFASTAAFASALNGAGGSSGPSLSRTASAGGTTRWRDRLRDPLTVGLLVTALASLTFAIVRGPNASGAARGVGSAHVSIVLPDGYELGAPNLHPIAIARDGSVLAYVGLKDGRTRIFMRALSASDAVELKGTEGAEAPFFSPDGQWIAFFSGGKLRKVTVNGEAPQALADAPSNRGGTWGDDGYLYFAPVNIGGLWRVAEAGGEATPVTALDTTIGEISHRWPQRIPGSDALVFSAWTGPGSDEQHIAVLTVGETQHHRLVSGGNAPKYLQVGSRLLYTSRGQLLSLAWRPRKQSIGAAIPVATGIALNDRAGNEGSGNYAVSGNGTLVYLEGGRVDEARRVVWVDRSGALTPVPLPERAYESVALSPDGGRAVMQIQDDTTRLWIYDFDRGTMTPLVTGAGSNQAPLWTPDGTRVIYRGTRRGTRNLYWTRVDGTGEEERLTSLPGVIQTPSSISADGQTLYFDQLSPGDAGGFAVWVMSLTGDRTPRRAFPQVVNTRDAQVSPDGRWVAYQALVASRFEVFVAPARGDGERRLITTAGGTEPIWSRDGRTLHFQSGSRLMGVDVAPGATFSASQPRVVHSGQFLGSINGNTNFSIAKDGSRFLRIQPLQPATAVTRISLVLNWPSSIPNRSTEGGSSP